MRNNEAGPQLCRLCWRVWHVVVPTGDGYECDASYHPRVGPACDARRERLAQFRDSTGWPRSVLPPSVSAALRRYGLDSPEGTTESKTLRW
jgi:hypothetical protein